MMNDIKILPVRTKRDRDTFLTFPWKIYHGDPLWVPPLLPERKKQIAPEIGPFFKRGEAEFFLAWKDHTPVGTICAAEDKTTNSLRNTNDCMFGFFEYMNDYQVAEALLNYVKQWGKQGGLTSLYGPWNLDYEDGYGVLLEGRDRPPAIFCGHTPPYYKDFMEQYGFLPARGQNLAFQIQINSESPEVQRLFRLDLKAHRHSEISIRCADFQRWDAESEHILYLLNTALTHLPDFIPWQPDALKAMLAPFREIADPELILFAEIHGKVIGFFPGIPNLNEIFIRLNGLRYSWNYITLLRSMRHKPKCLSIKSMLVLPEYWGSPVSVMLCAEMARRAQAKGYQWADMSLTSDDNPNTPILLEKMGARIYKRYQVYRLSI